MTQEYKPRQLTELERIDRLERIVAGLFEIILARGEGSGIPNSRVRDEADRLLPEWRELNEKAGATDKS